jgi:hypothetical protein
MPLAGSSHSLSARFELPTMNKRVRRRRAEPAIARQGDPERQRGARGRRPRSNLSRRAKLSSPDQSLPYACKKRKHSGAKPGFAPSPECIEVAKGRGDAMCLVARNIVSLSPLPPVRTRCRLLLRQADSARFQSPLERRNWSIPISRRSLLPSYCGRGFWRRTHGESDCW